MEVSEVQLLNDALPILVTALGILMLMIDVHPENANEPIVETVSEITGSVTSIPFKNKW
jgi:hypothetical protein